mgnify:CR=1 FL=1
MATTNSLATTSSSSLALNDPNKPAIYRKFQFTDLVNNNNKWWEVRWWTNGTMTSTSGRVGDAGQETTKTGISESGVQSKISEKLRKGYEEINLHVPTVQVIADEADKAQDAQNQLALKAVDQSILNLINVIFSEAGESISQYLAVGVDALSQTQIAAGRKLLFEAQDYMRSGDKTNLVSTITSYFKKVPTILPRRIDIDATVDWFIKSIAEQEDRLQQLETALISLQVTKVDNSVMSQYNSLGAEINIIPGYDKRYEIINDYVINTLMNHRGNTIKSIYSVKIPNERQAYLSNDFGKENVVHLFHGTNNKNLRHILRTGLIVPRVYTNGRRFGAGIYLADRAAKSLNYTAKVNRSAPTFLFITDADIGNPSKMNGSDSSLNKAPNGYHSVWGYDSYGGHDEFILYRTEQQTIRAIIEFNR